MTIEEVTVAGEWIRRGGTPAAPSTGRLRPLGLGEVTLRPGFWQQRRDVIRTASFAHIEHWLEKAGWLPNFDLPPNRRRGREFSDSEVYKFLEALAWANDPGWESRFRAVVARVAAAQQSDGYLNTHFGRPGQRPRYCDLEWGHELYCYGHLIQAGVARARTRGHDDLVTVAVRAADHVCEVFGPDGIASVCGHAVIETALVELYRVTGNRRYLDQARLFIERRGHQSLDDIEFGRAYFQDDVPIRDAGSLRGHAVRAVYLASGAVDVAVETGDDGLLDAIDRQWRHAAARRTYLTGGVGSRHQDEAYGDDFVLPPDRAYQETCAGVGSIMLAWRLLLARGEARYADLIERILFNIIATSPADDGTRFFYANTLHQRVPGTEPAAGTQVPRAASSLRAPWFAVSCCPTNLSRTFASLAAYIATTGDDGVQLHQYTPASMRAGDITLDIDTAYPDDGRITVRIVDAPDTPWTLSLRIPGWASEATVDGMPAAPGYTRITRRFTAGETVVLDLAVRPRVTVADPRIDAVRGSVAVERGPVVYCAESVDLLPGVDLGTVRVDPGGDLREHDGAVIITGRAEPAPDGDWPYSAPGPRPAGETVEIPLHPYHRWARRGPSAMRVWIPTV